MSFFKAIGEHDPITKFVDKGTFNLLGSKSPPPPPSVPNPNDAANAAQSTTDQMRMRRGLLANIYAGGSATAPVAGKTALGT
jgi:hypothetical protein